jgi:hypothetical protein
MDKKAQGGGGNQSNTTANATAATASLPNATFHSKLNMVMTNGSAMHDHEIYDFTLADGQCLTILQQFTIELRL